MAELTNQELLQPALLDRLTDDDPLSKQEPRERRTMTRSQLRQAVLRDLAWLFNSTRLASDVDFDGCDEARRSVINFGLPALAGDTASTLDVVDLERDIKQAILDFEPRILPGSLQVQAIVIEPEIEQHNVVTVEIRGELWGQPLATELLLRTQVDLETGEVQIRAVGA